MKDLEVGTAETGNGVSGETPAANVATSKPMRPSPLQLVDVMLGQIEVHKYSANEVKVLVGSLVAEILINNFRTTELAVQVASSDTKLVLVNISAEAMQRIPVSSLFAKEEVTQTGEPTLPEQPAQDNVAPQVVAAE